MLTYVLTNDDHGTFGVDSQGNLYKATNKTNFETKEKHLITVLITDNGYRPLKVGHFKWQHFATVCLIKAVSQIRLFNYPWRDVNHSLSHF